MSYPSVPARTFSASVGDKSNTATTGPDGIETDIDALRTFLTNILTKLQAVTDGDSGADGIGVTAIEGVSGTTVQAVLEAIIALGTGTLPPDGSINNTKLATDVKVGSLAALTTTEKSSIVEAINELVSEVANMPSTAEIAAAVWAETVRTITGGGLTAQQVWEYATRSLSDGSPTAQQIWEYATRSLSSNPPTAQEIWEYTTRVLTSLGSAGALGLIASSEVLFSNDTEVAGSACVHPDYVKIKEIGMVYGGVVNVSFDHASTLNLNIASVFLYKNGVAIGNAAQSNSDTVWSTKNETNIKVLPGDYLQLYGGGNTASIGAKVKNFRIKAALSSGVYAVTFS